MLLLLVLGGLIAFFRVERERPWEEMPVVRSRPSGPPVKVGLELGPDRRVDSTFRVELSRLEFTQGARSERGSARVRFDLGLVPLDGESRGGHAVELGIKPLVSESLPDAVAGWEDLYELAADRLDGAHPLGHLPERLAKQIRSRSFRMGESVAVAFDSEAQAPLVPETLPRFGRWRGWVDYAVQSAGQTYLVVRIRGGLRLEFPEDLEGALLRAGRSGGRALETVIVRSFLRPLGEPHQLRARMEGEIRCDHRTGLPAHVAVSVDFVVTGVQAGKPYTLSGTLLVRSLGMIRFLRN